MKLLILAFLIGVASKGVVDALISNGWETAATAEGYPDEFTEEQTTEFEGLLKDLTEFAQRTNVTIDIYLQSKGKEE